MRGVKLYDHQSDALNRTQEHDHVAYYHDMGLGKTFTGAEKMKQLNGRVSLIVCQKSKVKDWYDHIDNNYHKCVILLNLTDKLEFSVFMEQYEKTDNPIVAIINYDLMIRRSQLKSIHIDTLMLDESSLVQNPKAKRTRFIMDLHPDNVILLSGTPTGGKYENLLTQMHLLGWKISEDTFWNQYVDWEWSETQDGYWMKKVNGYKNEERLKRKMREHGCDFLKTEDVIDLPEQIDTRIRVPITKEYTKFKKNSYIEIGDVELIGDTILNQMLYERQLCGQYNKDKLDAFRDLVESTEDRLIVFYNFNAELEQLKGVCDTLSRPYSVVNGQDKDLYAYEHNDDSITLIQYQAGAYGLNLQMANKIVYFTPPLSSELFEQSKKRIHRIGQDKSCFYYYLACDGSIEASIYNVLAMRKDYTDELFKEVV